MTTLDTHSLAGLVSHMARAESGSVSVTAVATQTSQRPLIYNDPLLSAQTGPLSARRLPLVPRCLRPVTVNGNVMHHEGFVSAVSLPGQPSGPLTLS